MLRVIACDVCTMRLRDGITWCRTAECIARSTPNPAIFAEEMIRIFGGTWVYLGHESEISKPNDFVARTLGLRPIILTRDGSGKINALMNRCSHRAATVCRAAGAGARGVLRASNQARSAAARRR